MAKTILLADDSPTIRKIVELTFSESEIRVESVTDGRAALDLLERGRGDLVLADVALEEPSGYELCKSIKASERPVPVVLLAGTFEPLDPEMGRACGADGHLTKPFESQTLRDKVDELLRPKAEPRKPEEAEPVTAGSTPETAAARRPAVQPDPTSTPESAQPSPELVEAVARAVIGRLSASVVREIAWEVVPEMAAAIIRERIRELEKED